MIQPVLMFNIMGSNCCRDETLCNDSCTLVDLGLAVPFKHRSKPYTQKLKGNWVIKDQTMDCPPTPLSPQR